MRVFYTAAMACLVVLNVFFIFNWFRQKVDEEQPKSRTGEYTDALEASWKQAMMYSGNLHLSDKLSFTTEENESIPVKDIIRKNGDILILRIAQSFCTRCLDTEIPRLMRFANIMGKENIYLVVNNSNFVEVVKLKQLKRFPFRVLGINDGERLFDNINEKEAFFYPYLFTLDSTRLARSFHVVNASNNTVSENYYLWLKERLYQEREMASFSVRSQHASLVLEDTLHDFGHLKPAEAASFAFRFKNDSEEPLLIAGVDAGCGCTTADYPLSPVLPHDSAIITVTYDAKTGGVFEKKVLVYSNARGGQATLIIKGEVR